MPTPIKDSIELLQPELKDYFINTLGHNYLTAVQQCTLRYFLNNYDCVVQAPTGSGKTLAYALPTLQLIQQKREKFNDANKCEIYALIVVPSRELVVQIYELLKPICETLRFKVLRLVGGVKIQPEKFFRGQCIMIATPGCLEHWAEKLPTLKNFLKPLLVLVLDEADRYSNAEFKKSMTSFLAMLPKQRRTCLFSATQAKHVEEFVKFGLRNPIRLSVTSDKNTKIIECLDREEESNGSATDDKKSAGGKKPNDGLVMPAELTNYYTIVDANEKFLALVNLLNSAPAAKVLLFVCSGACVEYFAQILSEFLAKPTTPSKKTDKTVKSARPVLALYGRLDKKKRAKILAQFRTEKYAILLSTDLMARGLDLVDIDWVLQYDIPKYSSMFIHRSGRTARIGKEGKSLIFLTKEESGYIEYIQNHEKITLTELEIKELGFDNAQKLRIKIQELAIADRAVLENGTRAFVSFVQAYFKHDCNIVCRLDDLNLVGMAHSFGILRLPQMIELRKQQSKLKESFQPRDDVQTSKIAFKDAKLEARRQERIHAARTNGSNSTPLGKAQIDPEKGNENPRRKVFTDEEDNAETKKKNTTTKSNRSKKRWKGPHGEWEDLKESANVLKKFKKGKLSKAEIEELI